MSRRERVPGAWRVPAPRATALVAALLFAVGFVPLFGTPGYEQSLAAGLVVPGAASIASALASARAARTRTPFGAVVRGAGIGAWLALVAYVVALVHGLRVGFCDLAGGTRDFLLTAGAGAVLGGAYGSAAGLLVRRVRRVRLASVLVALAAPLGGVLVSVMRFYATPAIFAFDPFVGYFSGALYDTVVDAGDALLTYRAGSLASLVALVLGASLVRRDAQDRLRVVSFGPGRLRLSRVARLSVGVVAAAISAAVAVNGPALGHWQTAASIASALGAQRSGPRCDVVYPEGTRDADADLLVRDCEEELAAVEARLDARGPPRVTAFFFRDPAEKKRLMGAADTYIAKPWRHEVYLQVQPYPHPVLGHELAHVVAGAFGRGPFRIAGGPLGLPPNPGLIEGTAVFASPDDDELTPTEWARAMLDLGILPPIARVFSLDFLTAPAARSYTVAGAFLRWLAMSRGVETLRAWYGGGDVRALTGQSLAELDVAFRASLAQATVAPEVLAYAKAKFDRPGLFARHCPHVVDALRRQADACRDGLKIDRAVALYDRALARDPHDLASRLGRAVAEARFGDEARARAGVDALPALVDDPSTPRTYRDRGEEVLADLALLAGRREEAAATYAQLATAQIDEDLGRTYDVKAYAARHADATKAITALLVGSEHRPVDLFDGAAELGAWSTSSEDPVGAYLLGRNLVQRAFWSRSAPLLDRAVEGDVMPRVKREALRLRGIAACAQRDVRALTTVRARAAAADGPFATSVGRRDALLSLLARCAR